MAKRAQRDEEAARDAAFAAVKAAYRHLVGREDVPPQGHSFAHRAEPATNALIAAFFGLDSLQDLVLEAEFSLIDKLGLHANGRLRAKICQACVVTLEPVWTEVDEAFTVEFQPEDIVARMAIPKDDFETELPETMEGEAANIGLFALEILALAIPAYPRKEGVDFEVPEDLATAEASPLAVLGQLKQDLE